MAINLDKLVGFHESALTIRTERMEAVSYTHLTLPTNREV